MEIPKNMSTGIYKRTPEMYKTRKGRPPWNKGKKDIYSEETKKLWSKQRKGRKHTEEEKLKIGKALKGGNSGSFSKERFKNKENHPRWRGGISFEPYSLDWTQTLKRSIRERDKYTCQLCSKQQENRAFDVHHIDYDKKNCDPENLILLCHSCHTKTNTKRNYWINYFKK